MNKPIVLRENTGYTLNFRWENSETSKRVLSFRNLVLAIVLSAEMTAADTLQEDTSNTTSPPILLAISNPSNTNASPVISKRDILADEIWEEYDHRKEKTTKIIQDEAKLLFSKILEYVGIESKSSPEKHEAVTSGEPTDFYTLAIIGKKYLTENREQLIQKHFGKAIVFAHYKNRTNGRGQFVLLPIPRSNPLSEPLQTKDLWTSFTLTPREKSNGYNTEYIITSKSGEETIELAILYPVSSPEYKLRLSEVEKMKVKAGAIETSVHALSQKLQAVPTGKKTTAQTKQLKSEQTKYQKKLAELWKQKWEMLKKIRTEEGKLWKLNQLTYISYIPYTEKSNNSAIHKKGFKYLSMKMKETYESVFGKKVAEYPSTVKGLSIEKALPPKVPLILNIIERMDYQVYFEPNTLTLRDKKYLDETMSSQITRSLSTFWMNEQDSFNWQTSPVGAGGVGQIMPGTYSLFKKNRKYGPLFPESDFKTASQDHETSFRLQIAHFDDQICQLPLVIQQNWETLMSDQDARMWINALLAAGYNGNMKRVTKAILGDISPDQPLGTFKARLSSSHAILQAMENDRRRNVMPLEAKIQRSGQSLIFTKGKRQKAKRTYALSASQIAATRKEIAAINNTYKESMTYVLKTFYVSQYLSENFEEE